MSSKKRNMKSVGPFGRSYEVVDAFGTNIYVSHLYKETIDELLAAEKELDVAIELELTESEIETLQVRVDFLESVVELATKNFNRPEETEAMGEH